MSKELRDNENLVMAVFGYSLVLYAPKVPEHSKTR